jgi:hypothetical protein
MVGPGPSRKPPWPAGGSAYWGSAALRAPHVLLVALGAPRLHQANRPAGDAPGRRYGVAGFAGMSNWPRDATCCLWSPLDDGLRRGARGREAVKSLRCLQVARTEPRGAFYALRAPPQPAPRTLGRANMRGPPWQLPDRDGMINGVACARVSSRLTTKRLRAARFPEQDVDIFAAGNLRVRWNEMVVQLALAHDRTRVIESPSEVSCVPQCHIEECVTEIGPFYLVLAAE